MKHTKILLISTAFVACLNIECIGKSLDTSTQVSPKQSDSAQKVSSSDIRTQIKRFDRVYVGVFGGFTQRNIDYKSTPLTPLAKQIMPPYESDYTKHGFLVGPYVGYGKSFDNLYVGAEGSVHYDSANGWQNHSVNVNFPNARGPVKFNFKTQYKKEWVFGLAARLGILATKDSLFYIKPAIEFSKDKFTSKNVSMQGPGGVAALNEEDSISEWKMKLSPGVGAEYFINDNVSIRMEYSYSFGIKNSGVKEKISEKDDTRFEAKHTSHSLKIGVSYSF